MINRPDPDALLAGPLGEWLAGQQAVRDETRRTVRRRRVLTGVAAVLCALFASIIFPAFFEKSSVPVSWSVAFVVVFGMAWAQSAKKAVVNSIKTEINQAIARSLGLNFSLAVTPGAEWERAQAYKMLPGFNRHALEDCWSGDLGGLPFRVYEALCEIDEGSGKHRRVRTVFRGPILTVGFTRRFQGVTLIDNQDKHSGWFGGEKDQITIGGTALQRCDMVNPAFEDRFTVWGSDPTEAHYLVHPDYVERLIAVEKAFLGKNIRALFMGGELLIVLETGNQFESGGLEADQDRILLARTIDQFSALADLAQRLNEAPRGA